MLLPPYLYPQYLKGDKAPSQISDGGLEEMSPLPNIGISSLIFRTLTKKVPPLLGKSPKLKY